MHILFLILVAILAPGAFIWVPLIAATFFGKVILVAIALGAVLGTLQAIEAHKRQRFEQEARRRGARIVGCLVLAAALAAAMPAHADEYDRACRDTADIAAMITEGHQTGRISLPRMVEILPTPSMRDLAVLIYSRPRYVSPEMKQHAIEEARARAYAACSRGS